MLINFIFQLDSDSDSENIFDKTFIDLSLEDNSDEEPITNQEPPNIESVPKEKFVYLLLLIFLVDYRIIDFLPLRVCNFF